MPRPRRHRQKTTHAPDPGPGSRRDRRPPRRRRPSGGGQCRRLSHWRDVEASVWADRDAAVRVELRPAPRAVLNRGLPLNYGASEAEDFRNAEIVSTWWSALAAFPGPVVNRPTLAGFLPRLETVSLAAAVPGLAAPGCIGPPGLKFRPPRRSTSTACGTAPTWAATSRRCLWMKTSCISTPPLTRPGWCACSWPESSVFDLDQGSGRLEPGLAARVQPLVTRTAATAGHLQPRVVLGWSGEELQLLQATAFPGVHHYRHLENDVHRALLEYLT